MDVDQCLKTHVVNCISYTICDEQYVREDEAVCAKSL